MRTTIIGIVALFLARSAAVAAEPTGFKPLAFLVGEWVASGAGQPGAGAGKAVFSRSLQGQVILRTSYAQYPPADGKPGSRHDDLMIIYAGPGDGVRADYYDNEGHVIRYVVQSPAIGQAVFLSEAAASEPRYRLSYNLQPNGALEGRFEIAPPGAPDAFTSSRTALSFLARHSLEPHKPRSAVGEYRFPCGGGLLGEHVKNQDRVWGNVVDDAPIGTAITSQQFVTPGSDARRRPGVRQFQIVATLQTTQQEAGFHPRMEVSDASRPGFGETTPGGTT